MCVWCGVHVEALVIVDLVGLSCLNFLPQDKAHFHFFLRSGGRSLGGLQAVQHGILDASEGREMLNQNSLKFLKQRF